MSICGWPRDGAEVLLPTSFVLPNARRRGMVVNIAEYRLYFYFEKEGQKMVATFPHQHRPHGLADAAG